MGSEIRYSYEEIRSAIKKVEQSVSSMEIDAPGDLGSGNNLLVIKKINNMNQMLVNVTEQYKQLLHENNQNVEKSIDALHRVDQILASYMKTLGAFGHTVTK